MSGLLKSVIFTINVYNKKATVEILSVALSYDQNRLIEKAMKHFNLTVSRKNKFDLKLCVEKNLMNII